MKIICFPHSFYLSEVSRLIEIGNALRQFQQEVVFFSHGGPYESFVHNNKTKQIANVILEKYK